jgi:RecJ-like exonuclease
MLKCTWCNGKGKRKIMELWLRCPHCHDTRKINNSRIEKIMRSTIYKQSTKNIYKTLEIAQECTPSISYIDAFNNLTKKKLCSLS